MRSRRPLRAIGTVSFTLGLVLGALGVVVATQTASAATWTVNVFVDGADALPGDGICEATPATGDCTLRAAIQEANADLAADGADVINLASGTYTLTVVGTGEDGSATGDLDITSDITINGVYGAPNTIVTATTGDRIFHVLPGGTFQFEAVELAATSSAQQGVALYNEGTTDIVESSLPVGVTWPVARDNISTSNGGGIYNQGTMTIVRNSNNSGSMILSNNRAVNGGNIYNAGTVDLIDNSGAGLIFELGRATTSGGNLYNAAGATLDAGCNVVSRYSPTAVAPSAPAATNGGGLYNAGTASWSGEIYTNTARHGAGAYNETTGVLTLGSICGPATITSNIGSAFPATTGAGVSSRGQLIVQSAVVGAIGSANSAQSGGGIYLDSAAVPAMLVSAGGSLQVSGNSATSSGAGLHVQNGLAQIDGSLLVDSNTADMGAGIEIRGEFAVSNTGSMTVTNNAAVGTFVQAGGGIRVQSSPTQVIIRNSLFSGNTAGLVGGALSVDGGSVFVEKSSFDNSLAPNVAQEGGAIMVRNFDTPASIEMVNSTIVGNEASELGAAMAHQGDLVSTLSHVTIVDHQVTGSIFPSTVHIGSGSTELVVEHSLFANNGDDCVATTGTLTTGSFNVSDDGQCDPQATDVVDVSASLLDPLATGANPVAYNRTPQTNNVAIDAVTDGSCAPPADDQNNTSRPQDGDNNGSIACDAGAIEVPSAPVVPPPAAPTTTTLVAVAEDPSGVGAAGAGRTTGTLAATGSQAMQFTAIAALMIAVGCLAIEVCNRKRLAGRRELKVVSQQPRRD